MYGFMEEYEKLCMYGFMEGYEKLCMYDFIEGFKKDCYAGLRHSSPFSCSGHCVPGYMQFF